MKKYLSILTVVTLSTAVSLSTSSALNLNAHSTNMENASNINLKHKKGVWAEGTPAELSDWKLHIGSYECQLIITGKIDKMMLAGEILGVAPILEMSIGEIINYFTNDMKDTISKFDKGFGVYQGFNGFYIKQGNFGSDSN